MKQEKTNLKSGFTLLELLVVVLIIGILASIALPQYKKAVLKSRLASMFPYVKAVKDAQERYYMTNGNYSNSITQLDVNLTCPSGWTCEVKNTNVEVYPKSEYGAISIIARYDLVTNYPSVMYCWASYSPSSKQLHRDVCKSFGPLFFDAPSGNPPGISYFIQ